MNIIDYVGRSVFFSYVLIDVFSILYTDTAFHSVGSSCRMRSALRFGSVSLEDCFLLSINEILPTAASREELLNNLIFFEKYFFSVVLKKMGLTSHLLIRNFKSLSVCDDVFHVSFASSFT